MKNLRRSRKRFKLLVTKDAMQSNQIVGEVPLPIKILEKLKRYDSNVNTEVK